MLLDGRGHLWQLTLASPSDHLPRYDGKRLSILTPPFVFQVRLSRLGKEVQVLGSLVGARVHQLNGRAIGFVLHQVDHGGQGLVTSRF